MRVRLALASHALPSLPPRVGGREGKLGESPAAPQRRARVNTIKCGILVAMLQNFCLVKLCTVSRVQNLTTLHPSWIQAFIQCQYNPWPWCQALYRIALPVARVSNLQCPVQVVEIVQYVMVGCREKGRGAMQDSTGSYISLVLLGKRRRNSSGGVGRVTEGRRMYAGKQPSLFYLLSSLWLSKMQFPWSLDSVYNYIFIFPGNNIGQQKHYRGGDILGSNQWAGRSLLSGLIHHQKQNIADNLPISANIELGNPAFLFFNPKCWEPSLFFNPKFF